MGNEINRDQQVAIMYGILYQASEQGMDALASKVKKAIPEHYQGNGLFDNDGEPLMVQWLSKGFNYVGFIENQGLVKKYQSMIWELKGKQQIMAFDILMVAGNCQDYNYALATDVIQDDIKDDPEYYDYSLSEFRAFIKD